MRDAIERLRSLLQRVLQWLFAFLTGGLFRHQLAVATDEPPKPLPRTSSVTPVPPADGLPPELMLAHTSATFAAAVRKRLGRGDVLARALYRKYHASASFVDFELPPELCAASEVLGAQILGLCTLAPPLTLARRDGNEPRAPEPGSTEKYVLLCAGGEEVEMVAMPAPGSNSSSSSSSGASWSLCISSQVGCRMGCTFCETGRMGLLRNLSTAEIVAQVALAVGPLQLGTL